MSVELTMPALSPTMEKGTLARWLVGVGDPVRPGDLIAEIETDKATMEFEAIDEGVVLAILVPAATHDVPVGTPIAVIGAPDEAGVTPATQAAPDIAPVAAVTPAAQPASVPAPAPRVSEAVAPLAPVIASTTSARIKASPLARRLAMAQGIDLASVQGSGPGGRIVKADLVASRPSAGAGSSLPAPSRIEPAPQTDLSAQQAIPHDVISLSAMRRTIARRLTESKQTIPHIYLTVDVRLDALLDVRAALNESLAGRGVKVSVNDMMIRALALALVEIPQCNVAFAGDALLRFQRVDVAVAVSIPGGLITPVVAGADGKGLSAIAIETRALAERAREGRLQPHEYQGGTASLSNLGMHGIRQFDAVINPPQAMIMAVGAAEQRAIVTGGEIRTATMLSATGSFDHRAVDGADAAALMNAFRNLVENPLLLMV